MRLYTYLVNGLERLGVAYGNEDVVYPLSAYGLSFPDMNALIRGISRHQYTLLTIRPQSGGIPLSDISVAAPIPHPTQDVICIGQNYPGAPGTEPPEKTPAVYFSKRVNRAFAHREKIPAYWDIVTELDYEAELAVILGHDTYRASVEEAYEYVFGYTILNDLTARNIQTAHKQWYFGKSLDGFCPMGPCIVTRDAFPTPPALRIQTTVNGELRQDGCTDRMTHTIAEMISELSQGMMLQAGTIISTGSPFGNGRQMNPPKYLKGGDTVDCWIEGVGRLTNSIASY